MDLRKWLLGWTRKANPRLQKPPENRRVSKVREDHAKLIRTSATPRAVLSPDSLDTRETRSGADPHCGRTCPGRRPDRSSATSRTPVARRRSPVNEVQARVSARTPAFLPGHSREAGPPGESRCARRPRVVEGAETDGEANAAGFGTTVTTSQRCPRGCPLATFLIRVSNVAFASRAASGRDHQVLETSQQHPLPPTRRQVLLRAIDGRSMVMPASPTRQCARERIRLEDERASPHMLGDDDSPTIFTSQHMTQFRRS